MLGREHGLLHLFIPNYLMETPFHSLLLDNDFDLFNEIVNKFQINEEIKFDENFLEKIKEMFIFILENIYSYDTETIQNSYCNLSIELEIDQRTSNNVLIVTKLLADIKNFLFKHLVSHREILLDH
jgi:hypothetical protein